MKDLTLRMFLLQELKCTALPAAQVLSVNQQISLERRGVKVAPVDPGTFEHIRLLFSSDFSLKDICDHVERYYRALGYRVSRDINLGASAFTMLVSLDAGYLRATGINEKDVGGENVLNISVIDWHGHILPSCG